MAIYSLNHKSIGRTTHRAGRAGAHIRYIARRSAEPVIISQLMPADWKKAKKWIDAQELASRKNARVADLVMIALPIELNKKQRLELVEQFLESITGGRVPAFAAIHQEGEDSHNPHAHILIHDKSPLNGRRVLKMSEMGSTLKIREQWARDASMALKRAFIDEKIDHRSYREREIQQVPTRHRGWRNRPRNRVQSKTPLTPQNSLFIRLRRDMS